MNQPQASSATAEPQEITVRIDIKVKMAGNTANLTALIDKSKPIIEKARELGEVDAHALLGRQKLAIV
jgi:hypothetical protein